MMDSDSSDTLDPDDQTAPVSEGRACNGVLLALIASVIIFGWLGYDYGASRGILGSISGVLLGVAIGFLATPVLFIALVAFAHVVIKIETRFQKRDDR